MKLLLFGIVSYLLGSISFSYLFTKWLAKEDIRTLGSGNAGATNTLRAIGVGPALLVLLLDALKGMLPVWVAVVYFQTPWLGVIAGACAIIGHNWPLYYGFKGGKGVATTMGVFFVMSFYPALFAALLVIVIIAITRYVSLGSMVFMIVAPLLMLMMHSIPQSAAIGALLIGLLSIWRHKTNIVRLVKGNERKLGQ
ncbi:membrane protein [Fictibacillus macauensis ZFHKF-1]|uniref:Glycerol-3-phosphate acyltransferase n=1 Tax=Fictibacillus macauensis ZFHKF-1 TaxID=1196324 RepID=I8AL39_9BACL|nr:glycerol-3-phosphate 1-O-acyltransferase PlsY [Fictibacillus macauensis]EIT86577.1 membrane protein [Fictibacillus macauensis ZFHKF-1]